MPVSTNVVKLTYTEFVDVYKEVFNRDDLPERLWPSLYEKVTNEVFDVGSFFKINKVLEGEEEDGPYSWQTVVCSPDGINVEDPKHVYLIDHAWTYRVDMAKPQLRTVPGLLPWMANLMDIDMENRDTEEVVEEVFETSFKYCQTYNINNAKKGSEDATPIWYIMDEFGSRIQHSDDPSFRTIPFFYAPAQTCYTLLWPIKNLEDGDEVTRSYVEEADQTEERRLAKLQPWQPTDMTHIPYTQSDAALDFFQKYKMEETLPNLDCEFPSLPKDRNVRIHCTVSQISRLLTDPRFEFVEVPEAADIVWTTEKHNCKELSETRPHQLIGQFPFEMVLTVKDVLAVTARRAGKGKAADPDTLQTYPKWLPTTYNLLTELPQFVSYFQHRQNKGLDNHWICKPWNLARSLDLHVTKNLDYILRLTETGPKIACKYIEEPVLYHVEEIGDLKFDLRFYVMLSSVKPLKVHLHRQFYCRTANKPFSLDQLDDHEKHFTVMVYKRDQLSQIIVSKEDFISGLEARNPGFCWTEVEERIVDMFKEVFEAATQEEVPKGLAHSPQSRTFYGADVMLRWDTNDKGEKSIQPMLLELNFGPDLTSISKFHPNMTNDLFSVLFLEDVEEREVVNLFPST